MGIRQSGSAFDNRNPGTLKQPAVNAVQALNLGVLVGDQSGPVKTDVIKRDLPAITSRVFQLIVNVGTVYKQLLGYAPHVDTGASQVP